MQSTAKRTAARDGGARGRVRPEVDGHAFDHRDSSESHYRRWTLLVMCVATFMIQLDVTVVNVALPRIQAGLDLGPSGLEWVISAYALSLAALIPVGGALGDRYGRKRVFLAGMALFGLGSLACAVSSSAAALIVSRAVQGVGGAAMLALTLAIITDTFPAEGRAGAIGTWAAVGGTGFGIGPVVGGVLLTFFGWSSVFWVNVPFAVIGIAGTAVVVRESRNPRSQRLDRTGAVLSAGGLFAVTLGLVESATHAWGSLLVLGPLALGAALLAGFLGWEQRTSNAMIPSPLLRARSFTSACTIYFVAYTAFSGVLFYVTLLYQNVDEWSVLRTGASWLFMNIPFLGVAPLTGRLDRRFSTALVVSTACLVTAAGIGALTLAGPTSPFFVTAVGYVMAGAGFGALVPSITHVAMRDVPSGESGAASGVLNASRQIGTSAGLAVIGAIGVSAATAKWTAAARHLTPGLRHAALGQAQNVSSARIRTVTNALGAAYRHPAVQSFMHGYHLAVGAGALCLVVAAVVAAAGLGHRGTQVQTPLRDATSWLRT